jgi:hypothetical protein
MTYYKGDRMTPLNSEPGRCEECKCRIPARDHRGQQRKYCSAACRKKYIHRSESEGRKLHAIAKVWRKHRGAKGTPGEGKLADMATLLDEILEGDRERRELADMIDPDMFD